MDHRDQNSLNKLVEWDQAIANARLSIRASEELLARVRQVARSVDERMVRVLDRAGRPPE